MVSQGVLEINTCLLFRSDLLGNGIFGDKSIFLIFKNAYELFMNKFNATILNMDAIP